MKNFKLKCKFCGNTKQKKFQTTMTDYDGYSEYTVLSSGYVEFKCKVCGTFGTSKSDSGDNNKIEMFDVFCKKCGSKEWTFKDTADNGVDKPVIVCSKCGNKEESP
jgi:hypothetical protein